MEYEPCPHCGAEFGEPHVQGACDVEMCTACERQRAMCVLTTGGCADHDPLVAAWGGEWPGKAECRMRGWWAVMVPGRGWRPCEPGTPDCIEDLNRLAYFHANGVDELYAPAL